MAGLESARIMPEYRTREDQVHSGYQVDPNNTVLVGDVFYVTESAYLATNHLPVGTKGVVESVGGHEDFYKEPHFTIRVRDGRSFVAFPRVGHVVSKVLMRYFMEGQEVALLKELPTNTMEAVKVGSVGRVRKVYSDGLAEVMFYGFGSVVCAPDMCYQIEEAPPAKPALEEITETVDKVFAKHGGVTRSKKATHLEYVPASALEAIGRRLAVGIERGHQRDNWRLGVGNEEAREATINHLLHHIFDYLENGNASESNTDAIICNAAFLVEYEKHIPYKGVNQRRQNG